MLLAKYLENASVRDGKIERSWARTRKKVIAYTSKSNL